MGTKSSFENCFVNCKALGKCGFIIITTIYFNEGHVEFCSVHAENKRMGTHVTQILTKRKLTILPIDK